MKNYIIYETATKNVRWLETRQDDTPPIPGDGYSFADVTGMNGSVDTLWVDDSDKVRLRPERPSDFHNWDGAQWVEDTAMLRASWAERVRADRDKRLSDSDWTDTLSAKTRLGEAKYNEWQTYRQALRDISTQPGFPLNVIWPTTPA